MERIVIGSDPALDAFLGGHRWAVLTTLRTSGAPLSSVVAYARDGDTLVISTPGATFKTQSLRRDPRASLCVISNDEPFDFVNVEGECRIEHTDLERRTRLVFASIAATGYAEPPDLGAWLEKQRRVILCLYPERVYGVLRRT